MAIIDFYPFRPGQVVTAEQWNELFEAIRNGTFFLNNNDPLIEQISNISSRIQVLEQEVNYLKNYVNEIYYMRENFTLSDLQDRITLQYPPVLNSEIIILNATVRTKRLSANDDTWDYYVDGNDIIFNPTLVTTIEEGDLVSVIYRRS